MNLREVEKVLRGKFQLTSSLLITIENWIRVNNLVTGETKVLERPLPGHSTYFRLTNSSFGMFYSYKTAGFPLVNLEKLTYRLVAKGVGTVHNYYLAASVVDYPLVALINFKGSLYLWDVEEDRKVASIKLYEGGARYFLLNHEDHLILSIRDRVLIWTLSNILKRKVSMYQVVLYPHSSLFPDKGGYVLVGDEITFWKFGEESPYRKLELKEVVRMTNPVLRSTSKERISYFPELGFVVLDEDSFLRIWRVDESVGKVSLELTLEFKSTFTHYPHFHYSASLQEVFWGDSATTTRFKLKTGEVRKFGGSARLLLPGTSKRERKVLECLLRRRLVSLPKVLVLEVFLFL